MKQLMYQTTNFLHNIQQENTIMEPEICTICGRRTRFICPNIYNLRTSYSGTLISDVIERILPNDIELPSIINQTFACFDCILQIEDYDKAYTEAKVLEQKLFNIVIQSRDDPPISIDIWPKLIFRKVKESSNNIKIELRPENNINEAFDDETVQNESIDMEFKEESYLSSRSNDELNSDDDENDDNNCYIIKKKSKTHECFECGEIFKSRIKLNAHVKTHENKPKCEICGTTYKNDYLLEIHLQNHKGISDLVCAECDKVFSTKGALIKHRRIHRGDYKYQCEECGKQFIHDSSIRMHKLIHKDVREKVCVVCDRRFRSTQHLDRHLRTHTGEKPYYCSKCGKTFSQKYNMMTHCSKVHQMNVPKRQFKCSKCFETFSHRYKLSEHNINVHDGDDTWTPTLQANHDDDIETAAAVADLNPFLNTAGNYEEIVTTGLG